MIPEAKYVEPSPEWCVRDAKRNPSHPGAGALWRLVTQGQAATAFSDPHRQNWDGVSFWREARVTPTAIEIEFNENWRERFTNPEWKWHTLSRETFVNA